MARSKSVWICLLIALSIPACAIKENAARNVDLSTPSPTVAKPDDRIRPEGWTIPTLEAGKKNTVFKKENQDDGTTLEVREITFRPLARIVADLPPHGQNAEWIITEVTEFSHGSERPFCYQYKASPFYVNGGNGIGVTTWYRLCDEDGDSVYETRESNFAKVVVPEWAKHNKQ